MTTSNEIRRAAPAARAAERLQQRPAVAPPVDIYESSQEVLLLADLPGVTADGLTLHLDGDQLALEGRRTAEDLGTPLAMERRPADFRRSFVLPPGIDVARISAELHEGVLRLRLPKSEAVKPRRIPVAAG